MSQGNETAVGRGTGLRGTPEAPVKLGYLLSQYPAISHTFFLHEVLGLRARGIDLSTASINAPDRGREELSATEASEANRTFYVKGAGVRRVLATVCKRPGVALRGLRAWASVPRLGLKERVYWLFYLAEAMLVGQWMAEQKIGHLHVHFGGPVASVGMLTAAAWKVPYSLTIHGPEELLNVDAYHLREKVCGASFVVCISDFCKSQLCQLMPPEQWSKFAVVRLGVDPVSMTPPERAAGTQAGTIEILCTGRLVAAKGHRVLLQSVQILRERGAAFHVSLIGGGPERASLEAFVMQHDLGESVSFLSALGHAKTLSYLRKADIFVLASFAEGIPVALMEAMSLGVACVSTNVAGIPELIQSGVDGVLVPPANAEALADALEALIQDAAMRRELGNNARETIIRRYNLPLNHELLAYTLTDRVKTLVGARQ